MLAAYTRRDFPSLASYRAYLNTALVGLIPYVARDRAVRSLLEYFADPVGKVLEVSSKYATLKELFSRILNVGSPRNVTFTGSTTSCILRILASILVSEAWERRRLRVGVTVHEYPGVVQGVRSVCHSLSHACEGVTLIGEPGVPGWEDYAAGFLEETGGVVVASSVAWVTGYRADVASVGRAARRSGGYLIVDGAQQVGHTPLNPVSSEVDALCTTTKKWLLNPLSSMGVAYVSDRLVEGVTPYSITLHNQKFKPEMYCSQGLEALEPLEPKEDADRFMTISKPSIFSLDVALVVAEYMTMLSPVAIHDHVLGLRKVLEDLLEDKGYGYALQGESYYRKSGIVLVETGLRPAGNLRVCKDLQKRGVSVSCRGQAGFQGIRVSLHIYNSMEDIHVFVEELERMVRHA